MSSFKDNRRRDKFKASAKHFRNKKYAPRTQRDIAGPRVRPAEDTTSSGSRKIHKQTAEETLSILEKGYYEYEKERIEIDLSSAIENTITYSPDERLKIPPGKYETKFEVALENTLDGCNRMRQESDSVGALNFASAKHPGGGFLNGASAQEESLARASGLYKCIVDSPMYEFNNYNNNRGLYSDYMIFSPNVPVFRNSEDELLPEPYLISFLTAPAVNAGSALKKGIDPVVIATTMKKRIKRMLSIMAANGNDTIILGSWGCGVFRGNISELADTFYRFLTGKFKGVFRKVLFSTLSENDYEIFQEVFE